MPNIIPVVWARVIIIPSSSLVAAPVVRWSNGGTNGGPDSSATLAHMGGDTILCGSHFSSWSCVILRLYGVLRRFEMF